MDAEFTSLIKVWTLAISSLTYCYFISSTTTKPFTRLLLFLPINILFTLLPLTLTSFHLITVTFVFFSWIANSKLILLAFNQGPLASQTNLLHFILLASLPIKTKSTKIQPRSQPNPTSPNKPPYLLSLPKSINFTLKLTLLFLIFQAYHYRQNINHYVLLFIYGWYLYLEMEILLTTVGTPAQFFGFELDPQFDEPYLSTSLQDFWGLRWNLMATNILRQTIYYPIRNLMFPFGKRFGHVVGVLSTFVVSGLVHELLYYYLTKEKPTWEVTGFFTVNGVAVIAEGLAKRRFGGRVWVPTVVGGVWAYFVVVGSAFWLYFPPMVRTGALERGLGEMDAVFRFLRGFVKI